MRILLLLIRKDKDTTKRMFRLRFNFKNKKYDKSQKYYLVAYDDKNDIEVLGHEIIMDIAFADDFGFLDMLFIVGRWRMQMDLNILQTVLNIGETIGVEFKRCGNGIESDVYESDLFVPESIWRRHIYGCFR